jgi:hypothetical protein
MQKTRFVLSIFMLLSFAFAVQVNDCLAQRTRAATPPPVPKKRSPATPVTSERNPSVVRDPAVKPVIIAVSVSGENREFLTDLKAKEFSIVEDGVGQLIEYIAPLTDPLSVVLLLDVSGLTPEKIEQVQRDAMAFVEKLAPQDRIRLMSFDSEMHDLCDFTTDREKLRQAIAQLKPGAGSRIFEALHQVLNQLNPIQPGSSLVIFTDGVDWRSTSVTEEATLKLIEASGVVIYPVRYGTRDESERTIRRQLRSGKAADYEAVFGIGAPVLSPAANTTTISGTAAGAKGGKSDQAKVPDPPVVTGRPDDNGVPPLRRPRYPNDPARVPGGRSPVPTVRRTTSDDKQTAEDKFPDTVDAPMHSGSPGVFLDDLYQRADAFLEDIAEKSGGKVYRSDSLFSLPVAFEKVAEDIKAQLWLGYYPSNTKQANTKQANTKQDGQYRKLEIKVNRKNAAVRARPGYRAGNLAK